MGGRRRRSPQADVLASVVAELAHDLPTETVEDIAFELERLSARSAPSARLAVAQELVPASCRAAVARLIAAWNGHAQSLSPDALAFALRTAARADERRREEQTVEIVWSGPTQPGTTSRRTEQVLLDLIEGAKESLILVTYAAYKVPRIVDSLRAALDRGVQVTLILESPEKTQAAKAFKALVGDATTARVGRAAPAVYVWPLDERPKNVLGNSATLHAKCAIADDSVLFISSANLTESAMDANMELGLVIRGGKLPCNVAELWRSLTTSGSLRRG